MCVSLVGTVYPEDVADAFEDQSGVRVKRVPYIHSKIPYSKESVECIVTYDHTENSSESICDTAESVDGIEDVEITKRY